MESSDTREFITKSMHPRLSHGYCTYLMLVERGMTVEQAQKELLEFALERFDDNDFLLYCLNCYDKTSQKYLSKLICQETLLDLLEDPQNLEFNPEEDITLLMVADTEKGFNKFCSKGETENKDISQEFEHIVPSVNFLPPVNPIREKIRKMAIGDKKIESSTKERSRITQTHRTKEVIAKKDPSKAGTQGKLNMLNFQSKTKMPAPKNNETKIGGKRKREEMEKSQTKEIHVVKTEKRIKSKEVPSKVSAQKAKFDSNLYSLEESDDEKDHKQEDPVPETSSEPEDVPKEDNEDENRRSDNENEHPNNITEEESMEVDSKPMTRTIKTKVLKEEIYFDEEGFECVKQVEHEIEKEVELVKPKTSNLAKKKQTYKAPSKGQSSLKRFFG
ncbi:unnamed protein product [Moneuplotes crassus]|uniref:DNA polymerase delta subunit 3 n=1 Tax=Euplotes crassus TaxID=5936 RepID=A0AAD1XGQ4_EUPCR|nr:unnamed protein product [Moneuplotes crassus]